jgi:hypothetical protein
VDRIQVLWPDGSVETFPGLAVNKAILVRKGEGRTEEARTGN